MTVADWLEATVPAVAVNVVVALPAATETEAGTVSNGLLLARVTTAPPAGAACDRANVQVDAAPVLKLAGAQDRVLGRMGAVKVKAAVMLTAE